MVKPALEEKGGLVGLVRSLVASVEKAEQLVQEELPGLGEMEAEVVSSRAAEQVANLAHPVKTGNPGMPGNAAKKARTGRWEKMETQVNQVCQARMEN